MANAGTKRPRGCLFYGGITLLVLFLVILIAGLVGLQLARRVFNQFTDTKPAPLPTVQMSQTEMGNIQRRVEAFRKAVRDHSLVPPLTLTADDINALVASDPELEALKGKLFVTIEGNSIKGQLAVPLEELGMPMFTGRYLNGTGTFAVSLQNGVLRVTLKEFLGKGKPLPGLYMGKIRKQNLAANANADPRAAEALGHVQDIQVKDGQLIIVPK
jgi:hypothetical protein